VGLRHRRSQDFVGGVHFFDPKSCRPCFSRRPQRLSKSTSKSKPRSKNCPKIALAGGPGGCTLCPGGALTHFSCKLGLKIFFSPPWGMQVHPLHPLWLRLWSSKWHAWIKSTFIGLTVTNWPAVFGRSIFHHILTVFKVTTCNTEAEKTYWSTHIARLLLYWTPLQRFKRKYRDSHINKLVSFFSEKFDFNSINVLKSPTIKPWSQKLLKAFIV